MDSDKKSEEKPANPADTDSKPATDTSSNPNEETVDATSPMSAAGGASEKKEQEATEPVKKQSSLKQTFKRFKLYILLILFIAIIGIAFVIVSSLNNRKAPPATTYGNQTLSQSELKQLSTSNETVGGKGQTLTVQGNTDLTGNSVIHGDLNVAGTIQSGSQFTLSQIKVSGTSTFSSAQITGLQVANSATFQGPLTLQQGVNVAGGLTFTGPLNVASLTDTNLVLASNAQIQGHISFAPPANAIPHRQVNFGVLGNGGSSSVSGTDTSGTVSINTGNNPQPGCFTTIIFNIPYTTMPNILLSPINIGAGESKYYITETKQSFKICTNNAAPPNQAFAFDYFVGATPN